MRSVRNHPVLAAVLGVALVGFAVFGYATGAKLTTPYLVIVGVGALGVGRLDQRAQFSRLALAGLALWGIGHLAGGIVGIDHGRILYNALLPGRIHFDNVVHFVGFGSAGLAAWEALRYREASATMAWFGTWLCGMGVGACNEVIEFGITHVQADTQIGGFQNTGRDLVANMLGAAVMGGVAARRIRARSSPEAPRVRTQSGS